jgi:uncharacterized lipoprotein
VAVRIRQLLGSAIVVLGGLLGTGCAFTVDRVKLEYQPQPNVQKIDGASSITVVVTVDDTRGKKDRVSSKKNGYGMETAAIVAENDVPGLVKSAIEEELKDRGFGIGGGPVKVNVELEKFYCNFKSGFFSGDAEAEVRLNVQILVPGGTIAYARGLTGEGREANVQLASGDNAKLALDRALKAAVEKLFKDQAFLLALMPPRAEMGLRSEKGPRG